KFDRGAEISDCQVELRLLHETETASDQCQAIVRPQFNGAIKVSDAGSEILFFQPDITAVVIRLRKSAVYGDRPVEISHRAVKITKLVAEGSAVVVRFIKTPIDCQRMIEIAHCSIPIALCT